jgi:hypothetical protein
MNSRAGMRWDPILAGGSSLPPPHAPQFQKCLREVRLSSSVHTCPSPPISSLPPLSRLNIHGGGPQLKGAGGKDATEGEATGHQPWASMEMIHVALKMQNSTHTHTHTPPKSATVCGRLSECSQCIGSFKDFLAVSPQLEQEQMKPLLYPWARGKLLTAPHQSLGAQWFLEAGFSDQ